MGPGVQKNRVEVEKVKLLQRRRSLKKAWESRLARMADAGTGKTPVDVLFLSFFFSRF